MWFQISGRLARHVELFGLSSEIEVLGPRFEKSRFIFGLFRGTLPKSETSFENQLLILFHKCGLRFSGRASKHHATISTASPSFYVFLKSPSSAQEEISPCCASVFRNPQTRCDRGESLNMMQKENKSRAGQ